MRNATAEIVRLNDEIERLRAADRIEQIAFARLVAENVRLRAVNADMLAALQACIDEWGYENPAHDFAAITQARAAKAKATLEPLVKMTDEKRTGK